MEHAVRIALSLLPVLGFLFALKLMDGYKLMRLESVMFQVLAGVGVAVVALLVNRELIGLFGWRTVDYSRYAAPVVEESLKGVYLAYLVKRGRFGFMIDAAICGFALGTGFALVENAYYLGAGAELSVYECILRGFGTAVMHGGATTVFGIVSQSLSERFVVPRYRLLLPGLLAAMVFHSLFNHLLVAPVLTVVGLVLVLPLLMVVVFQQSERRVRQWVSSGLDADSDLLAMITEGHLLDSRIGRYLESLRESFPPEAVADMLNLLQLHAELSIKAKGVLLMREAGFSIPPDPEVEEKLRELEFLERNIGRAGMLAMAPFLRWRTRDLWQLHMLGGKRRRG